MLCNVRRQGRFFIGIVAIIVLGSFFLIVLTCGISHSVSSTNKAVFRISSNKYIVNGNEQEMDAAPFIFAGRAFVPVRYLGYACGVTQEDIVWDGAQRKVTLRSGSKSVEFIVGSKKMVMRHKMVVSPLVVDMDVAPILKEGRVYVPARWGAEGLGHRVSWDSISKTVTIRPDVIRIPPGGDF